MAKSLQLRHPLGSRLSRQLLTLVGVVAGGLVSISTARAQDPKAQDHQDQNPPSARQPQPSTQQTPPPAYGRDTRPVTSRDTIQQDPNYNGTAQPSRPSSRPPAQPASNTTVPPSLTIPAGTIVFVRVNEPLSTDHNQAGDRFAATLDRPIVVDGWVVARRGETIVGDATLAKKAGRVKGVSQLGLELTDMTMVDGQQLPVLTELWKGSGGTSHGADAASIATTTGAGTIIGAAADGGTGAGIGAGAGAVAGIALVLLTRGKPTIIGPEALLSFQLKDPVTVSTANSQQAFLPVGPNDYSSRPSLHRRGDNYVAYPPAYYSGCDPYWGCGPYYGYYGPYVGFGYYGGFYHHGYGRVGFRR